MPFADVGDVRLFFTDEGSGDPAFLFVHGYSCDSHDWMWQLPHFGERHRVIAADNRGHGRSSIPDTGYEPLDFAGDLAALLDQLGCGPVVAVGHSLGGIVVSALAVERPDLVEAIVSIDPGYLVPDELGEQLTPVIDALNTSDPIPVAQGLLASTYTPASPAALRTWHMRRIAGVPAHVLRQTITSLMEGLALTANSAPYLARRKCPVLALHTNPAHATAETGLFADTHSRAVTFEGSGHWIHQERPAEVNYLIDSWVASLRA